MIAFGHTAVGSMVGLASYHYLGETNTAVGLLMTGSFGVISHYIADFIPHGHFVKLQDIPKYVLHIIVFDLLLSLLIFIGFALSRTGLELLTWYILFGIGGSQLPDVIDCLIDIKKLPKKGLLKLEFNFHQSTHWHGTGNKALMWGISDLWQVSVVIISLILIFIYT